jgi:hypothetical protein
MKKFSNYIKALFYKYVFILFLLILRDNKIEEKGAEVVSKGILSLSKCPLTNFSLNL